MRVRRSAIAGLVCALTLAGQTPDRAAEVRAAREMADRGNAQSLQQALSESIRITTEAVAAGDTAAEADAVYLTGVVQLRLGRFPEAVTSYQRSVALYRQLGNRRWLATALNDLGLALSRRDDQTAALAALTEALEIQNDGDQPGERAITLNNLGLVYNELGDPARSRSYFEQVLAIRRQLGDKRLEGAALSNIGSLFYLEGDLQKALDSYLEAFELRQAGGDRRGASSTLSKVGLVYSVLNRPDQALRYFEQALAGIRESGDRFEEADALSHMGGAYRELGQFGKAQSFYEQSLKLQRETGRQLGYANDLANLSMVCRDQGQYDRALRLLEEALQIDESIHEQRDTGTTLERIGAIQRLRGNDAEALRYLGQALDTARQLREKQLEAASLYERGLTHAQMRDWQAAFDEAEAAIRVTESIRGGVASFEMRSTYVASIRGEYELAIDSLMHLHSAQRALEMSERSRARSLLDMLSESRGGVTAAIDPALQKKAQGLEASIGVLESRLLRMQPAHNEKLRKSGCKRLRPISIRCEPRFARRIHRMRPLRSRNRFRCATFRVCWMGTPSSWNFRWGIPTAIYGW
jgi:tetratricopeptide (TPR) repeat protein